MSKSMSALTAPRTRRLHANRRSRSSSTSGRPFGGWRRYLAPVALLALVLGLVPAAPAAAAGQPGVLVSITDANGTPITSVVPTGSELEYQVRVSYTCTGDTACTNMSVFIAPPPLDPYYGTQMKETRVDWIPPFSPAPPRTGSLTAGYTVNLGTVAAGGTGQIVFRYFLKGSTPGFSNPDYPGWTNFFPPGSPIDPQVTVTADNVTPVTGTDHATFDNIVPTPSLAFTVPGATKTDTEISLGVEAWSGCYRVNDSGFTKTYYHTMCSDVASVAVQLPAKAAYVAGSGGTYNAATHTVTVSTGTAAWLGLRNGAFRITFPSSEYPTSGAGCTAPEQFVATGTVTYLNGEVKATSPTSLTRTTTVDNCEPFRKGAFDKSANAASHQIPTTTPTNGYWLVDTHHQGNTRAIATVTDTSLDQPGMPVYNITTNVSATIDYTLDDGTTGSVTNTTFTAPSGRRIVAATLVSSPLAPANTLPSGGRSSTFRVFFNFSVQPGSTPGNRVNTASAVLTYPDNPELDAFTPSNSPDSATINLTTVTPFAKSSLDLTSNLATYAIPVSGAANGNFWRAYVCNQSNVQGVATVNSGNLDLPGIPVSSITTSVGATITYTLDNGTTATTTTGTASAPAGRRIVSATVVSPTLAGANNASTGTACTPFNVTFNFGVQAGAAPGDRTLSTTATMSYPNTTLPTAPATGSPDSHTVSLYTNTPYTINATPAMTVTNFTNPGFAPRVGDEVRWTGTGQFCNLPTDRTMTPQYVFLAPAGWNILPNGASLTNVPGATFNYKTVTYSGVTYNAVVVQWPAPVAGKGTAAGSACSTLSSLVVRTSPTLAAVVGNQTGRFFVGDAANVAAETYSTKVMESTTGSDIDTDGNTADSFASSSATTGLQGVAGLSVVKEICAPDASQSDGCDWVSDSAVTVGVAPSSTSIKYRVTIRNNGQTNLSNVVAYDVLPYPGDVGTSNSSATTPRGSTVSEALSTLTPDSGTGMTLAYSASTNPPRPEVYSGATTGTWTAALAGARSIRATIPVLNAATSRTFIYEAALVGASADQTACNSVAVAADTLVPSEPPRVCASTQEADLEIMPGARLPLQVGRVGTVPFEVTNNGGSANAGATVTLSVPTGVNVESLAVTGWACTAPSMTGPVSVECKPVSPDGLTSRELARDVTETIPLRVRPTASAPSSVCIDGAVSGVKHDPNDDNNDTSTCSSVAEGTALGVTKEDGRGTVAPGDTYTYKIDVTNQLVAESVASATLTDTLPAGLQLVSSTPAATVSGQTLTWTLGSLAQAGVASASGGTATGGSGSTTSVTVTVKVLPSATGKVANTAEVSAPDPAAPTTPLTAQATDTDDLLSTSITKSSDAAPAGVRAGDVVTYTLRMTNDGTADYTAGAPARLVDDLSGVLDDATFVAGSAQASVDGGATSSVGDPENGRLNWSGPLSAGDSVVVTYKVKVGTGAPGDVLTNTAYAAGTVSSCIDGLTPASESCATVATQFAPTLAKVVTSSTQNDDGTWTIVYSVVVTNESPTTAATYTLSDALAFGSGITVSSAAVTSAPAGVTPAAWTGTGAIANAVSIPASSQHTYQLTVVADAGTTGGTPAASCVTGAAGGFANRATLATTDGRTATAEACAAPAEPTVDKTVTPAVQLPDGRWSVNYTVTVSNTNAAVLPYSLVDALSIPTGIAVDQVSVSGPAGAPVNGAFNGSSDRALLNGVDRIPAGSTASPATRVFTVELIVDASQAGAAGISALTCAPAGTGGYVNDVALHAGSSATVLDSASACTNALPQPVPTIAKDVVSASVDADGDWVVEYEVTVTNPDATYSTRYSLEDELQFAAGSTVESAVVTSTDATVSGSWDGAGDTDVATNVALPAAGVHHYSVSVTVDPGTLDSDSALADCRIDAGETGTGFRNIATVTSGVDSEFAAACEPFTDPSVVKTTTGAPTQDPETGIWTLEYDITVTNKSTSTTGTIPYELTDELGFPADVDIVDVVATAPTGGTVNAGFDGDTDTDLGSGAIGAAADAATPAVQVFHVSVDFRVPAGLTAGAQCDPAQGAGGLRNEVEVAVGDRVSGSVACADLPDVPLAGITKSVVSQEQQADGTWEVLYRVTVANPSATAASTYSLDDEFAFGEGIELDAPATILSQPVAVTVNPGWDGVDAVTIAEDILLPAAGSHTYTVRAVIDSGTVTGDQDAGNCTIEPGETGTGFGNTASIGSGIASADAEVCAQAWDPGVTKELNGVPVQQSDGSWLLSYTMTVSNPSLVALSYGLVDELDFPAGTDITIEFAAGRAGSPTVEADWDGQSELQLVADGTPLPANAVHVFDVTVRALLPEDQESTDGGWVNTASVESGVGGVITTDAVAAADILVPELAVSKVATPSDTVLRIGDTVGYEVTLENVGDGAFTALYPAVVWDDLSDVLDDAELTSGPQSADVANIVFPDAGKYRASAPLAAGETVTVVYVATVTGGGNANLVNTAFVSAPDEEDPVAPSGDACADPTCAVTETALPALSVAKSVNVATVAAGDELTYTVTVRNTGLADIPADDPATVTDDLADVLDDSRYNGDAKADSGAASVSGTTLSWTGGLAVGESATITYSVTVAADAKDGSKLTNVVITDPTFALLAGDSGEATTTTKVVSLAVTGGSLPWFAGLGGLLLLLLGFGALVRNRRRKLEIEGRVVSVPQS